MQGSIRRNLVAVAAALMLVGAAHASSASAAVPGLQKVRAISAIDSASSKTATAYCPAGKRVIGGGGGLVWDLQHHTRDVVLTGLLPVHPLSGPDSYAVTAHEDQGGTTETWWVESYAICADPIAGMHTVVKGGTFGSASVQTTQPTCNAGERVLGTGGWIQDTGGQVGIQVSRASTTGTFSYFQAHEDADGYAGDWGQLGYAICAPAPAGYEIAQTGSPEALSEAEKAADTYCTAGKKTLSGGGAVAFSAPGNVFLTHVILAGAGLSNEVVAVADENVPTAANWDFIVGQAICAS
jgi:hypothetical protein